MALQSQINIDATGKPSSAVAGEVYTLVEIANRLPVVKTITPAAIVRPANVTGYTAGDAWSTTGGSVVTFAGATRLAAGGGKITKMIVIDSAWVTGLPLTGELWLFDTSPAVIADNAAFVITDAEAATLIAVIPFNANKPGNVGAGGAGNAVVEVDTAIGFNAAAAQTSIFGLIKVTNAYVPVSGESLTFRLTVEQFGL